VILKLYFSRGYGIGIPLPLFLKLVSIAKLERTLFPWVIWLDHIRLLLSSIGRWLGNA
jgi:hypothetical protein